MSVTPNELPHELPALVQSELGSQTFDASQARTSVEAASGLSAPASVSAFAADALLETFASPQSSFAAETSGMLLRSAVGPVEPFAEGELLEPSYVFGGDGRGKVSDTLAQPYASAGRLWVQFPDGRESACSGALIGPAHFLTAAHCVYSQEHGGQVRTAIVSAAQSGAATSFRRSDFQFRGEASATNIWTYDAWRNSGDHDYDIALIALDRNLGSHTGHYGFGYNNDNAYFLNNSLITNGYPGDRNDTNGDGQTDRHDMYVNSGRLNATTVHQLRTSQVDVMPGQSGGPLYNSDKIIYGVVSHGASSGGTPLYNAFTRIESNKFNDFRNAMAQDRTNHPVTDRADLVDYDAWFNTAIAAASSYTVRVGEALTMESFPRNNGTAASGNFTVRYRLSRDQVYDANDALLGDAQVSSVGAFQWGRAYLSAIAPAVDAGQYYVVWSIDAAGAVTEFVEGNNTGVINRPLTVAAQPVQDARILGTVFQDDNSNGLRDSGESPLANWTVYLDANRNGARDAAESAVTSDAAGAYQFNGLAAGSYSVRAVARPGWEQTHPGLASTEVLAVDGGSGRLDLYQPNQSTQQNDIITTGSLAPLFSQGVVENVRPIDSDVLAPMLAESRSLIGLDRLRSDSRFATLDGRGTSAVILDTGIDRNHPFFGADSNGDGTADRIVYQYDFADNDSDASDRNGHGSNVASIVGGADARYGGVAPGADLIALKVFPDSGPAAFAYLERALQWVAANAATYHIATVNMSLGIPANFSSPTEQVAYGISDELAALARMGVIVVSAAGNDYVNYQSEGVSYPAADPNSLAVSAVWDSAQGGPYVWGRGETDYTTAADRVTSFSQRHESMTDAMAPGARITGAGPNGDLSTVSGTSQAAPHVAGVAALAQQLARRELGRSLTQQEFSRLLRETGASIRDGDDEDDNVINTGRSYRRVDAYRLAEAVLAMAGGNTGGDGAHEVVLSQGAVAQGVNFGFLPLAVPNLSVNDVVQSEGNAGFTDFNFTVRLSAPSSESITVQAAAVDRTATVSDNDFQANPTTLVFAPGQTAAAYTVRVTGDQRVEADETFAVVLSAANRATIADGEGIGRIVNDDAPPPSNTAPVARDDRYVMSSGSSIAVFGVLRNDTDADGDTLTASLVTAPTRGSVEFASDGRFTYIPGSSFSGYDRFEYLARDATARSNVATVEIYSHNATLVRKLYWQVLGREPDAAGLQFHTARVNQGATLGSVAAGIFESPERLDPIIRQMYRDYLHREADAAGLAYYRATWQQDGGPENVRVNIISSTEFFNSAGGTNRAWVGELYKRLLQRTPAEAEVDYWTQQIESVGRSRRDVVRGFLRSRENFANLVTGWYQNYFGAAPTTTERDAHVNQLVGGASERDIQMSLINSERYKLDPRRPSDGLLEPLLS